MCAAVVSLCAAFAGTASQSTAATFDLPPGLVGHWLFDEGVGTQSLDAASNDGTAILENGVAWGVGRLRNALVFDGGDDRGAVAASRLSNLQEVTVTAWIYPTRNGGVLVRKSGGPAARFNLFLGASGVLGFRAGYTSSAGSWSATTALSLSAWHHFAASYRFGDIQSPPSLYVDGRAVSTTVVQQPSGSPTTDDDALLIGNNVALDSGFAGRMDNLRIYDRALSGAEVATIHDYERAGRPNIIVIMTDDQEDGPSVEFMPTVKQELEERGLRFTRSYVDNPLCCPSRATFLTGQCSHNSEVFFIAPSTVFNGAEYKGGYQTLHPTSGNTLPVWLQQVGYQTGIVGKYVNGYGDQVPATVVPRGWDRWFVRIDSASYSYFNYRISDNGTIVEHGAEPSDYVTDVMGAEALAFVQSRLGSDQPFFLWFTPLAPHTKVEIGSGVTQVWPPDPAPRHLGRADAVQLPRPPSFNEADLSDKPSFVRENLPTLGADDIARTEDLFRKRLESLLAVDESLGTLLDALDGAGQLDNTYVLFTSDNGFFLGEHRLEQGKRLVYEESIRVPWLMRGPGVPHGQSRDQLVGNVDLTATVLDLASAVPHRVIDGRSVMPIVANAAAPWRSALLVQGGDKLAEAKAWIETDSLLYGIYRAVRTARFLYAEHEMAATTMPPVVEYELYDLAVDPFELDSQHAASSYASVRATLADSLAQLAQCAGASCWITAPEPTLPEPTDGGAGGDVGPGADAEVLDGPLHEEAGRDASPPDADMQDAGSELSDVPDGGEGLFDTTPEGEVREHPGCHCRTTRGSQVGLLWVIGIASAARVVRRTVRTVATLRARRLRD